MKTSRLSVLIGTLIAILIPVVLFLWSNYHRASVEERAYELMINASQAVLGTGDWSLVFENMDPETPSQIPDMTTLRDFGSLVTLGEMVGIADVPLPLSGQPATAQLRIAGHFSTGICFTEAILVYRDGRWLFSHFAYIPGTLAQ